MYSKMSLHIHKYCEPVTVRAALFSMLNSFFQAKGMIVLLKRSLVLAVFACCCNGLSAQNNLIITGRLTANNISVTGMVEAASFSGALTNGVWNASVIAGQYGGTGVANTGRTITLAGNLITTGSFATTFAAGANTVLTLPTADGTLSTLAGSETLTNKTISGLSNTLSNISTGTLTGTIQAAQFPALTGDITTTAGSLGTTLTNNIVSAAKFRQSAANSLVGNATGSLANVTDITLGSGLTFTGSVLNTNTTGVSWNGNVITGQFGGTGVNNGARTITLAGNLVTTGSFSTTFAAGANTTLTLPTVDGTLSTLAGSETLTNKTISGLSNTLTNISTGTLTGTIQAAQFPALTGDITTTAGNLGTTLANNIVSAGKFRQSAANSLVGNATGSLANVTDITLGSGLTFTGSVLNVNAITSVGTITSGTWNATAIAGQYGGTGVANTGRTITIAGNLVTTGSFSTTFAAGANTVLTLPTADGTLSTLAGTESLTNKTLSTGSTWNGNLVAGQYGGTGVNNGARTITLAGNLVTTGAFSTTFTAGATTVLTLPTVTGTLATLAGTEPLTNKTINGSLNTLSNIATSTLTGTIQAAQFPALTGDITTTAGSLATTITANAVTNADLRQSVARSLIGNATAATANVTDITIGSGLSFTGTVLNVVGALLNVQVLTSGTSYSPTTGTSRISIWVVGPGGGGGGGTADAGAGGGGAGGVAYTPYLVLPGAGPFTYAIGAGGTGNGSAGSVATTITIGSLISGGLGSGGGNGTAANSSYTAGGNGGAASGGTINIAGQPGGYGGRSASTAHIMGGEGGSTMWGIGGRFVMSNNASTGGANGTGFGSGGGGAADGGAGGDGMNGVIIIFEYD